MPHPVKTHLICLQAAFYALEQAGFLIRIQKNTFLDDQFTFLGFNWNLREKTSGINSDRIKAIINHRIPRSLPELGSQIACIQYYESYVPLMKQIALPLYQVLKSGKFTWTKIELFQSSLHHVFGNQELQIQPQTTFLPPYRYQRG